MPLAADYLLTREINRWSIRSPEEQIRKRINGVLKKEVARQSRDAAVPELSLRPNDRVLSKLAKHTANMLYSEGLIAERSQAVDEIESEISDELREAERSLRERVQERDLLLMLQKSEIRSLTEVFAGRQALEQAGLTPEDLSELGLGDFEAVVDTVTRTITSTNKRDRTNRSFLFSCAPTRDGWFLFWLFLFHAPRTHDIFILDAYGCSLSSSSLRYKASITYGSWNLASANNEIAPLMPNPCHLGSL